MVGKCLADPNLNKTIGSCKINIAFKVPKRILCSKWLAWRGAQIHPYTCVIDCIVVSLCLNSL